MHDVNRSDSRAFAFRAAGELGRIDQMPPLIRGINDPKQEARFWAAWSAVLLGNRGKALEALASQALKPGLRQMPALRLAMQAMDAAAGRDLMRQLSDLPDGERLRIIAAGLLGEVEQVPSLIGQASDTQLARAAGEAFVNITGADFTLHLLEASPPDGFEDGPTDNAADENVDLPEDVLLPWPDVGRLQAWWQANGSRFSATVRYFLGAPITSVSCTNVLRTGFQRQRNVAASYLTLLEAGTPLFNTSAPAWRQQKLLDKCPWRIAELSPRTFCTFRCEFSSFRRRRAVHGQRL